MNKRIKELRKKLNLTQTEFGEKIGRGQKAVQYYENGLRGMDDSLIILIGKIFNVNEEWLRTGKGEMFVAFSEESDDHPSLTPEERMILKYYNNLSEADKKMVQTFISAIKQNKDVI